MADLRIELWGLIDGQQAVQGERGTIRTVPENYYVASIMKSGDLVFEGIEANTRNLDQAAVRNWYQEKIEGA